MDASQWAQLSSTSNTTTQPQPLEERKLTRPLKEQPLNCPRCNSINTKFCYYNNYSLSQPRYYCKSCKRYWTQGGSLRNVPIGGGSRKNKKHSSTISNPPQIPSSVNATSQIQAKASHGHDLNLNLLGLPSIESVMNHNNNVNIGSAMYNNGAFGFNDFSLPSYMKLPNLDGIGSANLGVQEGVDHGLLLPNFGDTKNFYMKSSNDTNGHQNNPGSSLFWNIDFNGNCGSR